MNQVLKSPKPVPNQEKTTRDLFIRGVPSKIWEQVHVNAILSRQRLKDYLIQVLEMAKPFPPVQPKE